MLSQSIHRRQMALVCEVCDPRRVSREYWIRQHQQRGGTRASDRCERAVELVGTSRAEHLELNIQCPSGHLCLSQYLTLVDNVIGIPEDSHWGDLGDSLLK